MLYSLRCLLLLALLASVASFPAFAGAQTATSTVSSHAPVDLAAMALAAGDVPAGFFDESSEWWVPAGDVAALTGADAAPAGLARLYQGFYVDINSPTVVHNYLLEFITPEAAQSGVQDIAALLRPPLPDGTVIGPEDETGPTIGGAPSVLTSVTYDTWEAGGPRADVVAVSFVRGTIVAGVSVERYTDPPDPGTTAATPVASMTSQQILADELATILAGRVDAVLAGQAPPGIDSSLADLVLPLDQLAPSRPIFGGYRAGSDLLRCGSCGEENALAAMIPDASDGFVRGMVLGPVVDGEPTPPFVSVAIATFSSPEAARQVLAAIRSAPGDRPTAIPVPRGLRSPAADPDIPGAEGTAAFVGTLAEDDATAEPDSAGVTAIAGDRLVFVDVLGGLSADDAMRAAIDLAQQQVACLASENSCQAVTLPDQIPQPGS